MNLGLREGVWLSIALLAAYLCVLLARLIRLRRLAAKAPAVFHRRNPAPPAAQAAPLPPKDDKDDDADAGATYEAALRNARAASAPRQPPRAAEPAPMLTPDFQLNLEMQQLRRDLAALRSEHVSLQRAHDALARTVGAMRTELAKRQVPRPISPEHEEAQMLAGRGLDAAAIAERCGISVAEAELVCALNRRGSEG